MTDWSWLSGKGNIGELPIQVASEGGVEILPGYAEGFEVGKTEFLTDDELCVGDVCILTCEVTAVSGDTPTTIDVAVHHVEYVNKADEQDSKIDEMMSHLDQAKRIRQERRQDETCSNCENIDSSTRISANDDRQNRDLHYCAQCGRLLSTKEYEKLKDIQSM